MDLYELRDEFDKSGILICFNGPFHHSIMQEIGTAMRNHLAEENIAQEALMDVFAVYIEMAQNVSNYITFRQIARPEAASSIITISRSGEGYQVSSGNIVLNEDVETLCRRVDEVNAMTRSEIRSAYKKQMRRDVPPDALGAGLGLLEIAKRSSEKMTYAVKILDAGSTFFSLTANI
nr:SiaB family protein kinase [uncultured Desulfuromonas sp.]